MYVNSRCAQSLQTSDTAVDHPVVRRLVQQLEGLQVERAAHRLLGWCSVCVLGGSCIARDLDAIEVVLWCRYLIASVVIHSLCRCQSWWRLVRWMLCRCDIDDITGVRRC